MSTFEVTIESADEAPLRLLVEADNWVAAWQEGLRFLGINDLPADAECVVAAGGVRVEIPSSRRHFVVERRADHPGPRPTSGRPLLLGAAPSAADAISSSRAETDTRPDVPAVTPPARAPAPDPIARVLSELERQRLLSRPVRLSSVTGLPSREAPRAPRRHPTPLNVPRPSPTTDERNRPTARTQAFVAAPEEQLPQHFRPVQAEVGPPETYELATRWAVETAWNHVPCALVLLLACDEDEGPLAEIIAARGEREREARGCSVTCDSGPAQMSRAPSLTRFSAPRTLHFTGPDERVWELPVSSVLAAPVEAEDGELIGLGLVLLNASRSSGFTDSELRAVTYLARTLAARL